MSSSVLETRETTTSESESLDQLLEVYRRHGFDAGYHQALRDQLEGLVSHAERYLRSKSPRHHDDLTNSHVETRRLIYGFVALLESSLAAQSPLSNHTVCDGLGI